MKIFSFILTTLISFAFSVSAFAGMVEAKRDGVKVFAEANKKADVLKKLKKGEALETKERKGMYWLIDLEGKEAYVSVMKVKRTKDGGSAISDALRSAVEQGRRENDAANARQRSTVMGVRGLDENEKTAFAGNVKPNLRMVYAMEDIVVKSSDIDKIGDLVFQEIEKKAE